MNCKAGKIAGICAAAAALPVMLTAPGKTSKRQRQPFMGRNFAHRGLHTRDCSVPENSLEAFRLAAEQGYGVELDVQLSKDGQVVVFHDDTLDRVCGVRGRVDEFTYEQLRTFSLRGTDQRIPLFTDVLSVIDGRGPIICELKPGKRNRELCRKTYDIICAYKGDICIESFNPFIVAWFRFNAGDLLRGQLAMPREGYDDIPKPVAFALEHSLFNCITRPGFIAYKIGPVGAGTKAAQLMGAIKTGWTSHEPKNEKGRDMVIFEFYKPRPFFK